MHGVALQLFLHVQCQIHLNWFERSVLKQSHTFPHDLNQTQYSMSAEAHQVSSQQVNCVAAVGQNDATLG